MAQTAGTDDHPATDEQYLALAHTFIAALSARDFAGVRSCFAPEVHLRGLIPDGLRERDGAVAAAALFEEWFGACDPIETLAVQADTVADRVRIAYRLRLREDGEWYVVLHQAVCTIAGDRIAALDLLCSGFRPTDAPA